MFTALKRWTNGFIVKTRDLFNSPESEIYVKDLRKVITHKDGRKCQYPKNYHEIVTFGKIEKDNDGSYRLEYKGKEFSLAIVQTTDSSSYATINFLVDPEKRDFRNNNLNDFSKYYEPFGFSRIDLEKHIPVFEIDNTSGKLTPPPKKDIEENGKVKKVDNPKGRNGELVYASEWKKLNPDFFEIRDHNGNLELDKSLLSVPLAFATYSARVFAGWVTSPFMKVGEWLISKQNPVAKAFGYALFTPAAAVKNLVNIGSTILRFPILLFVADKEKYGDSYLTMWKHQFKESWQEVKDDFSVIKNGKMEEKVEIGYPKVKAGGTWKELNAMKPQIEQDLKQRASTLRSTEIVKQFSPAKKDLVIEQKEISNTETMCATSATPTPPTVQEGQNTSSLTPELGNSSNKEGSYADVVKKSRQNSKSNTTTIPPH
ncbi:MAG: hypothetical protein PG981_001095 [Wolbachia endosymbiont of Ctenocephalides orientis wCori]|nr:MAG: hypothetical protein PG981_001095 [Wolbachia endosymbiont of Ctenocephalides orientis wCori]